MTTTDDNKAIVRRFVDEIFVQGRKDTVDELLADDFVAHTWPSTGHPRDDLKAAIDRTSGALQDPVFMIDDLIAEGDRVAARITTAATQVGTFMGMPPSGKRYEIGEIHIFRLRDGKVVEHWHQLDQMGMMRQLGAMPAGGQGDGAQPKEPATAGATRG
ncbi:MAG TPA: ester cyclase [Candidatus Limnocylindrales bacterium]